MSQNSLPISPARFAAALKDLPLSALHLKAAELRNSIAHLDYSNEELRPFAYPTSSAMTDRNSTNVDAGTNGSNGNHPSTVGDPVCIEAIQENEEVIKRIQQRVDLLRAEVERRGASWLEFLSPEEVTKKLAEDEARLAPTMTNGDTRPSANGVQTNGGQENSSSPWTDGTFQTGRMSGGHVIMDGAMEGVRDGVQTTSSSTGPNGGRLDDEELFRRMEERMREAETEDDDEHGLFL